MFNGWEPAEVIALAGVIVAPLGALGAVWFQHRFQERREARAAEGKRQEEWAAVLAPVLTLLNDANPDRLGINANHETSLDTMKELFSRWREIREPLFRLVVLELDERTRDCARRLDVVTYNSLVMTSHFVNELLNPSGGRKDNRDEALAHYRQAQDRASELSLRVRGEVND